MLKCTNANRLSTVLDITNNSVVDSDLICDSFSDNMSTTQQESRLIYELYNY